LPDNFIEQKRRKSVQFDNRNKNDLAPGNNDFKKSRSSGFILFPNKSLNNEFKNNIPNSQKNISE